MQGREKLDPLKILTHKQENFCQEYISNGGSATNAYLAAYDTENRQYASVNGLQLTNHPLVAERIIHLKKMIMQSITIDPTTYVLNSLIELNETTLNDFIDEQGNVKALNNISKKKAKAISKIKIVNNTDKEGNQVQTIDISLVDRLQTIEKIAKHIDFYSSHRQSSYKQSLTGNRAKEARKVSGSEKQINLQQNFYSLSTDELEALLVKTEGS